jgi:hypothetical protein
LDPFTAVSLYKTIHLFGLLLLFTSLGGLAVSAISGVPKKDNPARKLLSISHGVALFLVLLGGFGLLAKLYPGVSWPGWIYVKIGVWVLLGGVVALIYRKPALGRSLFIALPLLGALAAAMVFFRPL